MIGYHHNAGVKFEWLKKILKISLCVLGLNAGFVNLANADIKSQETITQHLTGTSVTARVKSALVSAGLPIITIKVITHADKNTADAYIVTLKGTVDEQQDIGRAEDIASNVKGVKRVVNHLKTK